MPDPLPLPRLQIIIASTRPGRLGSLIAEWFIQRAKQHGGHELDIVDLAELNLPFLNEPHHPSLRQYTQQHTRDWSARVAAADGYVFVMPEYNSGFNAPLKNALDYLFHEWQYKPVGFVSYGGVSAGTRAMEMIKPVVTTLRMTPVKDAVNVPTRQTVDADGVFTPNLVLDAAATTMLTEIGRLATALAPLRQAAA